MKKTIWIPAVALLAVSCGGGEPHERPAARPAVEAPVASVSTGPAAGGIGATAGLEPIRRAAPGTVLMGRVESIGKREGDRVRAGETLARIASGDVAARKAQAEAAVTAARAAEENARRLRERMERLHARDAASTKTLEDATLGHEAAAAQLRAAEEGVLAADVYVGYATVRAPFDGVVTKRNVEIGDLAAPGMPLFTVEDLSRMKVEAQVAETTATALSPGAPVEVEIDALPGPAREGTIAEILPAADAKSRTFTVRVLLENPDGALKPGMFARLRLPSPAGDAEAALLVPETAIVRRGPLTGVFVLDDGSVARLRWITLGRSRDGAVEALTGLSAGERIVTEPPSALEDGRTVTPKAGGSR